MDRSRRIVDLLLSDIIGDGDISHLPGAGKPLCLDEDPHTPSDQRAAQKIMRDHNVAPEWIEAGNAVTQGEMRLLATLTDTAETHWREMNAASSRAHQDKLRLRWSRFAADFRLRVQRHNREALLYNLKAPAGIPHKSILKGDLLLQRALRSAKPLP